MKAPACIPGAWAARRGTPGWRLRRLTTPLPVKSCHRPQTSVCWRVALVWVAPLSAGLAAEPTGAAASAFAPEIGVSVLRVFGALTFVLALFLGGVWLFRNWQQLAARRGASPQLRVLETRPLGQRQALHLIGYRQQRFLLAASPAGVALLTHLPGEDADESEPAAQTAFAATLEQSLVNGLTAKLSGRWGQWFGASPVDARAAADAIERDTPSTLAQTRRKPDPAPAA